MEDEDKDVVVQPVEEGGEEEPEEMLKRMFPQLDEDIIKQVYGDCENSTVTAIDRLLRLNQSDDETEIVEDSEQADESGEETEEEKKQLSQEEKEKDEEGSEDDESGVLQDDEEEEDDDDEEEGPPSRLKQKVAFEELKDSAEMREGDTWYLVSIEWWNGFKKYTKYEEPGQSYYYTYYSSSLPKSNKPGPRPGPIDNSPLIDQETGQLFRNARERSEFALVPKAHWELLLSWYGGGPAIPRKVITSGYSYYRGSSAASVEIHLLRVNLVRSSKMDEPVVATFSKKSTCQEMFDKGVELLELADPSQVRMWDYHGDTKLKLLDEMESCLHSHQIIDRQKVLLEEKDEGKADEMWKASESPESLFRWLPWEMLNDVGRIVVDTTEWPKPQSRWSYYSSQNSSSSSYANYYTYPSNWQQQQQSQDESQEEDQEEVVAAMFPQLDREVVSSVLASENGNTNRAIEALLELVGGSSD